MKRKVCSLIAIVSFLLLFSAGTSIAQDGSIAAWGENVHGQCNVPSPNEDFVAVAAGYDHSMGLKEDGSIVAWGSNAYGQCNVPSPNEDFVAVSAGFELSMGLKADGSIVVWGINNHGQLIVPSPNEDFLAVASGGSHCLGLKADGSIVAWGQNTYGQCNVPEPNEGFVAIAAGEMHSMGLKGDGSIVAWGNNGCGQCNVPPPNEGFTEVAAGSFHSLGLKEDGSIVAWGINNVGQCDVPEPNEGFAEVMGGFSHSMGLREDGSIVAWGSNNYGQCDVPEPNIRFTGISAGAYHSTGLRGMVQVLLPDSSTIWTHFDIDLPIEWEYYAGSCVSIVLYKGSLPVYLLASSIANDGSWIYGGPLPMSFQPGDNYRIYVVDDMEYSCFSQYFTIAPSQGQHVITVTEPSSSTVWTHLDTDLPVEWEYPALSGFSGGDLSGCADPDPFRFTDSGENVAIFLYDGATPVDTLTLSTPNTGSWVYPGPVPEEWAPGDGYILYAVDDLNNYGWSSAFEIMEFVSTERMQAVELDEFHLFPVAPNPSWGDFSINYSVPCASDVTIDIYDVTGRLVSRAAAGEYSAGLHQLQLGGFDPGLYFCRMRAESFSSTERFVVVR